jgi:formylglycine-generating enzyme required for sulfatase activity
LEEFRSKKIEDLQAFFSSVNNVSVTLKEEGSLAVDQRSAFVVATYKDDTNSLIGAFFLDFEVAASLAVSCSDLPKEKIKKTVDRAEFSKEMWDSLFKVLSSSIKIFKLYYAEQIELFRVYRNPRTLPPELYEKIVHPDQFIHLHLEIEGYGKGQIALFDKIPEKLFVTDRRLREMSFVEYQQSLVEEELIETGFGVTVSYYTKGLRRPSIWLLLLTPIFLYLLFKTIILPYVEEVRLASIYLGVPVDSVLIKKGTFIMGCSTNHDLDCAHDQSAHTSTIHRDFYIMRSEVTQKLYSKIMHTNPSSFPDCGENCPVEGVTWLQAVQFANRLSFDHSLEPCYIIEQGQVLWKGYQACEGWRLPTEAEWEYAAHGTGNHLYSGSDFIEKVSWYDNTLEMSDQNEKPKGVQLVCGKEKNGYGLCDMSGNVWEWTWDWYGEGFYSSRAAQIDSTGPENGIKRVIRGGSWKSDRERNRSFYRFPLSPSRNNGKKVLNSESKRIDIGSIGFRLVRTSFDKK